MKPGRKVLWLLSVLAALFLAAWIGFYERPLAYFNRIVYVQMNLAGAKSRDVAVDGHRIHYYVLGPENAPPAVLVHGLGGHAEDWRNLAPYVVACGYRVYMPDLPGYGRSEKPANFSYSVPDEGAAVLGFMDALGLRQVALGGHSMGGWIAQWIAAEHPDRVKKLMLFDSAGLHEAPAWDTALFTPRTPVELDKLDALLFPHPPPVPAFIARDVLRESRDHAWIIQRALHSMLTGNYTTDAELPQLKMPMLIVWGALDRITPLSQGETIHQLVPQSQLDVIQGCGHMAPVQCADRVGPDVEAFLRK